MKRKQEKKSVKKYPREVNMWEYSGWGSSINWMDWSKRKIYGFMTPVIHKGDIIKDKLASGRIGVFKVVSVDRKKDPRDMFFAVVEDLGYEDELNMD